MSDESANPDGETEHVAPVETETKPAETSDGVTSDTLLADDKPKEALLDGDDADDEEQKPVEQKGDRPDLDYDDVKLPYENAEDIIEMAKEYKINKEGLERIVTMVAEREKSSAEAAIAEAKATEARISQEKREAFLSDAQAKEKLKAANWMLKQGSPETVALIQSNPVIANDPGLINLLAMAGNALREGRFREGESANAKPTHPAKRIYANSNF